MKSTINTFCHLCESSVVLSTHHCTKLIASSSCFHSTQVSEGVSEQEEQRYISQERRLRSSAVVQRFRSAITEDDQCWLGLADARCQNDIVGEAQMVQFLVVDPPNHFSELDISMMCSKVALKSFGWPRSTGNSIIFLPAFPELYSLMLTLLMVRSRS